MEGRNQQSEILVENPQTPDTKEQIKVPSPDDPYPIPPPNTLTPPHSYKIRFVLRQFEVRIRLQRIPAQAVNLRPNDTEFYLDTFKYTKKYLLRFKYPQNVKVDVEKCTVDFSGDFLLVKMPIIEIKDNTTGKLLRKKNAGRIQQEREKPEKKNLKRKREKSDPKPQGKKKFVNNSQALKLIEKINTVEDKKREEKLNKEEGRNAHVAAKTKEKEDRKLKKQKIRLKSLAEVKKQNHNSEEIPKPKIDYRKSKRRVSFSDTLQVIPKQEKTKNNKQKNPKNSHNSHNNSQNGQQKGNWKNTPPPNNKKSVQKGKRPQRKKQRMN